MIKSEAKNLIGSCGLYCGLCNKFQSNAPSRCIGCKLGEQHSWCSIWNCCVKKHGFETCADCNEIFKCKIFSRRKVVEWIPAAHNLRQIIEIGLEHWLEDQKERQYLVEKLLKNYNEGRSMSFYCKVCSRMTIELITNAIEESEEIFISKKVGKSDLKSKAKIVKESIKNLAIKNGIHLT